MAVGDPVDPSVLKRYKAAADADDAQRKLELEDLKFCDDPDGQWEIQHRESRKAGEDGGISVAARPCLTINQVKPAVQQVANEARNARLAIQINPKGDGASQKTAEKIKGLYRNIEVESRAQMARMSCFVRGLKCGRGYYRVLKDYANDGDDDLDIIIEPIPNQHSVVMGRHNKPDGSDAMEAWITDDMPWADYKAQYGESKVGAMDSDQLSALGADEPDWFSAGADEESRTIRVAEHFKVTIKKTGKKTQRGKDIEERSVKWQKINGYEVLEEEVWEGRWIPILQYLADESNINGKRSSSGIVRNGKDPNRVYNVMASNEMESIGTASKSHWVVAEGQLEGYEHIWRQAHLRSYSYLPYRPKSFAGVLAPPPARDTAEPAIQAMSLARRQAREDIQTTTNTYDPSLGKGEAGDSGRKVQALQAQGRHGNSNYLTDFADVTMTHEARIVIDLMKYVYDRPGRVVKLLTGDDDTASSAMIGKPYVPGPDGEPQEAQEGDPAAQMFTLDGRYSVTATVGKSFSTQNEEADAMFGEIAAAAPQMVPLFADLWVRSKDMPYGNEVADRFKAMLPPQLQKTQDGQQQDPQQLQAQIGQLTMALQQAQQEAQDAQAGIAKAKIDAESREKIKGAELEVKQQVEQMKAELAAMKIQMEAGMKEKQIQADMAKTVMQQNAEHERQQREQQHADQQDQAARAHEHATRAADVGHESATHEADLAHEGHMAQTEHVHQHTESDADRKHAEKVAAMKPKPGGKST
jgi:hypothetical protein